MMNFPRHAVHITLFAAVFAIALSAPLAAAEELGLEVRETVGIARRTFSTSHLLELPGAVDRSTPFALLDDQDKPVNAQFTPANEGPMSASWWVDFQSTIGPWAISRYTVRYGEGVKPGPEGSGGYVISETTDAYQLAKGTALTWTVPRDLAGLLRSVVFPLGEHLRPSSPGLLLRDREGKEHILGAGFHAGRVVRQGRRAVVLRFTGEARQESLASVRSTVELRFPTPVSWVEVDWTIDDPRMLVSAAGVRLNLDFDRPEPKVPTLVDFGVGTWIYASLLAGQTAELRAIPRSNAMARSEPQWRILHGPDGRMTPFAVAAPDNAAVAEGWAHIMDRKRCLDLAIDRFGQEAVDRIALGGNGEVSMWREFPAGAPASSRRFRFWLHFVYYPPQWSAATNPLMMMTPPEVRTINGGRRNE